VNCKIEEDGQGGSVLSVLSVVHNYDRGDVTDVTATVIDMTATKPVNHPVTS